MRLRLWMCLAGAAAMAGSWSPAAWAQQGFELVTGKAFDAAVPREFYLEGNAIPTQKRSASLVKTTAGSRALFSLIDTTGYSSNVVTKYIGMLITEGDLSRRVERAEPRTEVGKLGLALNTMLDRIEESDSRLRRFVADASHELRTPLAAVRA